MEKDRTINTDEKAEQLKAALEELERLADIYIQVLSLLPDLSREYYSLQSRIRIKLRKMQLEKIRPAGKNKAPVLP